MIKKYSFLLIISLLISIKSINAQQYDEAKTKAQLEKYLENPKLYYEKMRSMTDQLNESKKKLAEYNATANTTTNAVNQASTKAVSKPSIKPTQAVNTNSPFKVQLASLKRDDLKKYLEVPKYLSFTNLGDRNVFEVSGFTNETDAYEFSQFLRKSGIEGAFVTKYVDGMRQDYNYLSEHGMASPFVPKGHTTMNLDYPATVPLGYLDIMNGNSGNIPAPAAATMPASTIRAKSAVTTPESKANTLKSIPPKPTSDKSSSTKSLPIAPTEANSNSSYNVPKSKLDEAFNKMFGK